MNKYEAWLHSHNRTSEPLPHHYKTKERLRELVRPLTDPETLHRLEAWLARYPEDQLFCLGPDGIITPYGAKNEQI